VSVTINHSSPIAKVKIDVQSKGSAIIPTASLVTVFEPKPGNQYQTNIVDNPPAATMSGISSIPMLGETHVIRAAEVNVGIQPYSKLAQELDGFKYKFDNFLVTNPEVFSPGDVVFFKSAPGYNSYNSMLTKANTSSVDYGAYHNLMVFVSYSNERLILMHKGYFDYEVGDVNITDWEVGRTLYLNSNSILSTSPTNLSGGWVKSLGFCIPNTDGKYRIWFESDSTYLQLA
jgi:hypothetical protein